MNVAWRGILFTTVAALAAGCASRAPAAFEMAPQAYVIHVEGPPAPPAAHPELVVASYNVHAMVRPAALRADLAALAFVDVWALQEVPVPRPGGDRETDADARHRQAFRESLEKCLPPGVWHVRAVAVNPIAPGGGGACEGQVIASRLPIRDAAVWPLGGAGKRRAALVAFIGDGRDDTDAAVAAAAPVAVVNTDHEPSFFSPAAGNDAQVRRLLAHLARRGGPAVVVGDFNPTGLLWRLRSHPADVAQLRGAMRRGGFAAAPHADDATFHAFPSSLRLDHLFLRDLHWLDGGVALAARGSDHRPVWCRVRRVARDGGAGTGAEAGAAQAEPAGRTGDTDRCAGS